MACSRFFEFFVLFFLISAIEARNKPPLMADDNARQRNKAAECTFGNQIRELGSQWIPDLGVPFGVLYCMKCECVQFQRKRRIVAKVQCRNIQKECPEPTCAEPVLLKGRCCKMCPGDSSNIDNIQDIDILPQHSIDEDERTTKHYTALLTGRSSLVLKSDYLRLSPVERNRNKVIATGRFNFHKKNLHYSFIFSDRAPRPRSLQFLDIDGNILEEFSLVAEGASLGFYQNATRKVCGVWKRMSRNYRRYLKQEKLFAALVWGTKDRTEFTVSGLLTKSNALQREMFTSLMEPAATSDPVLMKGSGGTAIISVATSISPSVHITVIFNGLFSVNEISQVPINITLQLDKKKILERQITVKKPSNELNFAEITAVLENQDLRALARGRLSISLYSSSSPTNMKLYGHIVPKATCEIFQALLTSNNEKAPGTTGLAWFYMNNDATLNYNIQVDNLGSEIPAAITLIDMSTKRKSELEDLTPYFENGWANGTVDRLSPKILEPFLFGDLGVNVATQNFTSLVRGKLVSRLVSDARDAPAPLLLKREDNYTLPRSAVGLAWLTIDNDCHIHYDIALAGLGFNDRRLDLTLELLPMIAPGAPVITKHFDSFIGNQVENSPLEGLTREELNRLDTGVGFLKIVQNKATLLSAAITQMQVPAGCRPPYTDNNVPTILFDNGDDQSSGDCFHEGKFYQEEAQWTSSSDPCTMCFCQNGKEKCDTMVCPEPDCPEYLRLKMPGECCPACPSENMLSESQIKRNLPHRCLFNGKPYSKGSKFHPFLIPTGFDSCTECTCDPHLLEIKCVRKSNEKSCCKNCNKLEFDINQSYPADEMPLRNPNLIKKNEKPTKSAEQILKEGGCRNLNNPHKPHGNGSEYHPYIDSLGFYKCVTCRCNKGTQTCKRNQCDKASCEKMFKARKNKTLNPAETCCSVKDCRRFRHRKTHRLSTPMS